ncbi:MAG: hypothetical protein HY906_25755 [Deltaproteobacteria bacterium]|nr:hypothetical protein [Deltaproteobacteria bacterium]
MCVTFRRVCTMAGAVILLSATSATAQAQSAGLNELSGHIGGAVGITDSTPGGFKLATEYGRKLSQLVWFNAQLNFVVGDNDRRHFGGNTIEMIAGVKLKFPTGRFLPYAKIGGGLEIEFYGGDHGATGLVFRGGGGLKYFVIPQLAVGGELVLTVGPNFIRHGGGTEAYVALDFLGGVEFVF